ncbi:lactadherin-like [Amphiura filiformis]|uniref:lactadherin-like n=1 Tax=Amphiura filiformis TaxID=82378 RepID=UPI003B21C6A0
MESGVILNEHITASDYYTGPVGPGGLLPHEARLNNDKYWITNSTHPVDPWIQVAFDAYEDTVTITGIRTQGSTLSEWGEWVTKLQIQYGDTEDSLAYIMDGSAAKTFNANSDEDTVVSITFPQPISARFLRIIPKVWHEGIALRFEVIGCQN